MKKSTVLLAAALLTFSLTACGQKAEQSGSQEETIEEPAVSSEAAEEPQEEPESSETTEPEGERFSSSVSEEKVTVWVEGLNLE